MHMDADLLVGRELLLVSSFKEIDMKLSVASNKSLTKIVLYAVSYGE